VRSIPLTAAALALATSPAATLPPRPEPIVVRVDDGGFNWDDASLGAAAGFGAGVALVGGLALSRKEKT
jgi:hypothetical protein